MANNHIESINGAGTEGQAPVPPVVDVNAQNTQQAATNQAHQSQTNQAQANGFGPNPAGAHQLSKVQDISFLLRNSVSATAFSEEGTNYVHKLKERLETRRNILPDELKVMNLSYPPESLVFICANKAILMIFSETSSAQTIDRPVFSLFNEAVDSLKRATGGKIEVRNTIIVTPQDYSRPDQMAVEIVNELQGLLDPGIGDANLDSFRNADLTVVTDRNWCAAYLNAHDPHGVPDRDSLQIAVCVSNRRNRMANQDMFNPDNQFADLQTLAVISGYTEFILANQVNPRGEPMFLPLVHISRIVSSIQSEAFIPLLLSVAVERWVRNGGWKAQFDDIGSLSPNIGNLCRDLTTNTPMTVSNPMEREAFIREHMTFPMPVLDIVNGRAHMPGLERYAIPEWGQVVLNNCSKFLAGREMLPNNRPTYNAYEDYVGYIQNGTSVYQDSRWIDYLNMMIHLKDADRCARLLSKQADPNLEFRVLKEFAPDLRPLYHRAVTGLAPDLFKALANAIRGQISVIDNSSMANTINMDGFIQMANDYMYYPQNQYSQQSTMMNNIFGPRNMSGQMFN